MNALTTSSNPQSSPGEKDNPKDAGNSQVLLPKTLIQGIKDHLKQIKKDTGVAYSLEHFVARVLKKHGMTEMEHLRKGVEKLNGNKG